MARPTSRSRCQGPGAGSGAVLSCWAALPPPSLFPGSSPSSPLPFFRFSFPSSSSPLSPTAHLSLSVTARGRCAGGGLRTALGGRPVADCTSSPALLFRPGRAWLPWRALPGGWLVCLQSQGTGGAKNNGEHGLGGGGRQEQEVASQCWRGSLRCPAWLASLGRGDSLSPARLGRTWATSPTGFQEGALSVGPALAGILCLAGDLACGPVPGETGSSLLAPAGHCS